MIRIAKTLKLETVAEVWSGPSRPTGCGLSSATPGRATSSRGRSERPDDELLRDRAITAWPRADAALDSPPALRRPPGRPAAETARTLAAPASRSGQPVERDRKLGRVGCDLRRSIGGSERLDLLTRADPGQHQHGSSPTATAAGTSVTRLSPIITASDASCPRHEPRSRGGAAPACRSRPASRRWPLRWPPRSTLPGHQALFVRVDRVAVGRDEPGPRPNCLGGAGQPRIGEFEVEADDHGVHVPTAAAASRPLADQRSAASPERTTSMPASTSSLTSRPADHQHAPDRRLQVAQVKRRGPRGRDDAIGIHRRTHPRKRVT